MTEEYKEKIANIEREVALANQFNSEVIKPFITEVKASLKDQPNRKEFDDLKIEVDGKVSGKTFGIVATVITIVLGFLSFVFNYMKSGN